MGLMQNRNANPKVAVIPQSGAGQLVGTTGSWPNTMAMNPTNQIGPYGSTSTFGGLPLSSVRAPTPGLLRPIGVTGSLGSMNTEHGILQPISDMRSSQTGSRLPTSSPQYMPTGVLPIHNQSAPFYPQSSSLSSFPGFRKPLTKGWPGITCPTLPSPSEKANIAMLSDLDSDTIESLANEFYYLTCGTGVLDKAKFQTLFLYNIYGDPIISANRLATNIFSTLDSDMTGKLELPEFIMAYKLLSAERDAADVRPGYSMHM